MKYNSSTFSTNVCKWWIFYSVTGKNWETSRVLSRVQLPTSSASPPWMRAEDNGQGTELWVGPAENPTGWTQPRAAGDSKLQELGSF